MFKFIGGQDIEHLEHRANDWLEEYPQTSLCVVKLTKIESGHFWAGRYSLCLQVIDNNHCSHQNPPASCGRSRIKLFEGNEADLEKQTNRWADANPNYTIFMIDLAPSSNGEIIVVLAYSD